MRRRSKLVAAGLVGLMSTFPAWTSQAAPSDGAKEKSAQKAPAKGARKAPVVSTAEAIPGEWIVTMKEGATARDLRQAVNLARAGGARSIEQYPLTLNGFSARMSRRAIDRLRAIPAVEIIEANVPMELDATQTNPPWGLDRIDQASLPRNSAYSYNRTGAGVRAYVVDSGVSASHNEFGGRVLPGIDTGDNDNDATDCNGHGTHVAGTIGGTRVGVAKQVSIVPVKVFKCTGEGDSNHFLAGVEWIAANHPAGTPGVVNASITFSGHYTFLERAVEQSIAGGLPWAISAGNADVDSCDHSLGSRVDRAIVVAASDQNDARGDFSNWGPCVDIFAPGVRIESAYYTADNAYAEMSGTSMAAPHVAGAAALYLEANPTATPARVKGVLVNRSSKDKVSDPKGSPNRLLYTGFIN